MPFTEPSDAAETTGMQRPLTSEQRHFEPPRMSWDATRSAPPAESQAEAGTFPRQRYEMSQSTGLFQAPQSYPEPPRDMYYDVPPRPEPAEKPTPIFPWENKAKKPTRVFAEAPATAPPKTTAETLTQTAGQQTNPETSSYAKSTTAAPNIKDMPVDALDSFSRTNAWDNVMSIEQYVRAVREAQAKRGKVQVLHTEAPTIDTSSVATSVSDSSEFKTSKRRESLIITDFPTEVERPSLPVTPAPIRRPKFWGEERNEQGELPAAEGVPDQSEWNPHERLEQLRKSSVAAAEELPKYSIPKDTPLRALPETSADLASALPVPATTEPSDHFQTDEKTAEKEKT